MNVRQLEVGKVYELAYWGFPKAECVEPRSGQSLFRLKQEVVGLGGQVKPVGTEVLVSNKQVLQEVGR